MFSIRKFLLNRHLKALKASINTVYSKSLNSIQPKISVCMPLHNCSNALRDSIISLESSLSLPHEYIFILDSCIDDTKLILLDLLKNQNIFDENKSTGFLVLESHRQLYETYCDYLGIIYSTSEYVLEVQSDMIIHHQEFDRLMLNQLESDQKLAIIGGRGCLGIEATQRYRQSLKCSIINTSKPFSLLKWFFIQSFPPVTKLYIRLFKTRQKNPLTVPVVLNSETIYNDKISRFCNTGCAGRLNEDVATLGNRSDSSYLFYSDFIIRGPILMAKNLILSAGNFDIRNFFLGFDDLDLCSRLSKKGFSVAYVYINFLSPLALGVSRKKKKFSVILSIMYNIYIRSKSSNDLSSILVSENTLPRIYFAKQLSQ